MSGYAVAQVDGIDEISDGRCPWRPVGFHFGITSFGVNAFTAHQAGDRLINEHDESQEHDLQEELYLVQRGCATSSSTASGWTHPRAHSSSFAPPLSGQRSLRSRGRRSSRSAVSGEGVRVQGRRHSMPLNHLYESGEYAEAADQGRELIEAHPECAGPLYNLACCESLAGRTDDAIKHSGSRLNATNRSVRLLPRTATSTRSATRPRSRSWFRAKQPKLRGNRLAPVASGDTPERCAGEPAVGLASRRWARGVKWEVPGRCAACGRWPAQSS